MMFEIDPKALTKRDRIRLAIDVMQDFNVEEVAFVLNDVVLYKDFETLFKMDYSKLDYSVLQVK